MAKREKEQEHFIRRPSITPLVKQEPAKKSAPKAKKLAASK
jgi:hypothetical protein